MNVFAFRSPFGLAAVGSLFCMLSLADLTLAQDKTKATPAAASSPGEKASSPSAGSSSRTVQGPPEDSDPTHLKRSEQAEPLKLPAKLDSGWVMDQCVQGRTGGAQYERPRAVVFAPASAELPDKDWPYEGTAPSEDVIDVFAARFPLDRFNNVVTRLAPDPAWLSAESLTVEQMSSFVSAAELTRPFGGTQGDVQARAAREKDYIRYSLACTDYVFVPRLVSWTGNWKWKSNSYFQDRKVPRTPSKAPSSLQQSPKQLYVPERPILAFDLAIFKREGNTFKILRVLKNVGAHGDRDTNEFSHSEQMPDYISAVPEPSCSIPAAVDGRAGLSCRAGTADSYAVVHDQDFRGPLCKERDFNNPDVWARCELRDWEDWALGSLQQAVRKLPEFRLYSPLTPGTLGPGFAIGKYEGVKTGMGFGYYGIDKSLLAYYKVVRPGPGGPKRENKISLLDPRYGEAPENGRLEEIPLAGWTFGVFANTFALGHDNASVLQTGGQQRTYALPNSIAGGGLGLAIDGSPTWLEWWVTLRASFNYGDGQNLSTFLCHVDIATEKGFYLGQRLKFVAEIGFSGIAGKAYLKGSSTTGGDQTASLKAPGGMAAIALDVLINPYWSVRAGLEGRYYSKTKFSGDDLPSGITDRNDSLRLIGTRFDLHYHF